MRIQAWVTKGAGWTLSRGSDSSGRSLDQRARSEPVWYSTQCGGSLARAAVVARARPRRRPRAGCRRSPRYSREPGRMSGAPPGWPAAGVTTTQPRLAPGVARGRAPSAQLGKLPGTKVPGSKLPLAATCRWQQTAAASSSPALRCGGQRNHAASFGADAGCCAPARRVHGPDGLLAE
jgi:hypothetical protein